MRIAIDGMGGDHAPDEIVEGAVEAARQLPDATLLLVGQKDRLSRPDAPRNLQIIPATEVVGMDEEPARALRGKPDSSLRVALRQVKRGEADAVVSAGNTGALVGGAIVPVFGLGNLEGVKRPGIAVPFPTPSGSCALIDAGANPQAKPIHLIQYAVMGSVYIKYLRPELKRPRVGLLNIGEESKKGTDLQKETYVYLEKADLNFEFIGNVEPHGLFSGKVDVVVCDGYTGNLALKMAEGIAGFIFNQLSNGLAANPAVVKAKDSLDYTEHGGAPVLGCRGIVIKCHGRSKARAITNAVKLAAGFIRGRLNDHIVEDLRKLSWSAWFSKWFSWSKEGE
ncbi:MAG TPA: phosphate acyltransferase PlsX [Planctomycetota bacterium]|nr:phosphate acyltransferase PlsX [Planctomycetota bacterium]